MVQSVPQLLTFEEFVAQYGDDSRYELMDGELVEMEPTGPHEQVSGFINLQLNLAIARLKQPFFIPMKCLIKPLEPTSAFKPDVVVLDRTALRSEPLWQREPIITLGSSVKLVVEVVSTNWQNDYARKVDDYYALGIPEYWIIDYLGLGGTYFIGSPKQPTVTLCQGKQGGQAEQSGHKEQGGQAKQGSYEMHQLRSGDYLVSSTFPDLRIAVDDIFNTAVIES